MGAMTGLVRLASDVCTNPEHARWIPSLLLLADSVLCALILQKIPYTEIDWTTYMEQVSLFISGERDYASIKGSTGPLVYPAVHVYIYSLLYHVTDEGRDIPFAQVLFTVLYLTTLCVVMACYRAMKAPPYLFPLLVLSKRLHSVFLLRLFNDGIATFFLWTATWVMLKRQWYAGVMLWAVGVGVKMTLLLVAPAIAVVVVHGAGLYRASGLGIVACLFHVLLAAPFLLTNATSYVSKSFELSRQFLFKWTVNWRFVGEEIFLSRNFALTLLAVHVLLLVLFAAFRWILPAGTNPITFVLEAAQRRQPPTKMTSSFIGTTVLTSLVLGLLCARSLHYQFFAYLAWASPFLLWKSGFHPMLIYLVWAAQEWAWNVYPSTTASSITVVVCLSLQVFGSIVNAYRTDDGARTAAKQENNQPS